MTQRGGSAGKAESCSVCAFCGRRLGLPAKDWLAGGADLIKAADTSGVRSGLNEFRSRGGLVGDRTHGIDEEIALFAGFRFGWLDHERSGNDQRKRGGVGMEAIVDEALGDVHGVDAVFLLERIAENDLVHGGQGIGQIENPFEMLADVIRVEDGVFRGLAHAGAVREDVSERANENAEISAEGFYTTDGVWPNLFQHEAAALLLDEDGHGAEGFEDFFHGNGTGAGTAAAVRRRKSLMKIEVHDVYAEIAGAGDAGQGIHVGAVHVEKSALGVQDFGDFRDALFKNAEGGGIGEHQRGDIRRDEVVQLSDVNLSVRFGLDVFDFVAGDHGGGGIGAVGRVWN